MKIGSFVLNSTLSSATVSAHHVKRRLSTNQSRGSVESLTLNLDITGIGLSRLQTRVNIVEVVRVKLTG